MVAELLLMPATSERASSQFLTRACVAQYYQDTLIFKHRFRDTCPEACQAGGSCVYGMQGTCHNCTVNCNAAMDTFTPYLCARQAVDIAVASSMFS